MTTHPIPMTDTLTRGRLLRRLLTTERDWGPMVARIALGAVMFPHPGGDAARQRRRLDGPRAVGSRESDVNEPRPVVRTGS